MKDPWDGILLADYYDHPWRERVAQACADWAAYRREAKLKPYVAITWRLRIKKAMNNPRLFLASVENSMEQGYQGIHPPNEGVPTKALSALQELDQDLRDRGLVR